MVITRRKFIQGLVAVSAAPITAKFASAYSALPNASIETLAEASEYLMPHSRWLVLSATFDQAQQSFVQLSEFLKPNLQTSQFKQLTLSAGGTEYIFRAAGTNIDTRRIRGMQLTGVYFTQPSMIDPQFQLMAWSRTQRYPRHSDLPTGFKWPKFERNLIAALK